MRKPHQWTKFNVPFTACPSMQAIDVLLKITLCSPFTFDGTGYVVICYWCHHFLYFHSRMKIKSAWTILQTIEAINLSLIKEKSPSYSMHHSIYRLCWTSLWLWTNSIRLATKAHKLRTDSVEGTVEISTNSHINWIIQWTTALSLRSHFHLLCFPLSLFAHLFATNIGGSLPPPLPCYHFSPLSPCLYLSGYLHSNVR